MGGKRRWVTVEPPTRNVFLILHERLRDRRAYNRSMLGTPRIRKYIDCKNRDYKEFIIARENKKPVSFFWSKGFEKISTFGLFLYYF